MIHKGPNVEPPPASVVQSLAARAPAFWQHFAAALDEAAGDVPIEWTSWYRSAPHNIAVGGIESSQHRYGTAVDLVVPADALHLVKARLQSSGLLVIDEGTHLHVQAFPAGALQRTGIAPG